MVGRQRLDRSQVTTGLQHQIGECAADIDAQTSGCAAHACDSLIASHFFGDPRGERVRIKSRIQTSLTECQHVNQIWPCPFEASRARDGARNRFVNSDTLKPDCDILMRNTLTSDSETTKILAVN